MRWRCCLKVETLLMFVYRSNLITLERDHHPHIIRASEVEMPSPIPCYDVSYKKFWEELIACFPLIRHGPYIKLSVQQFFYFCMCVSCRRNVFTEPLPSNDGGYRHRQQGDLSLLTLFWKNESRLMKSACCLCIPPNELLNAWTNLYETWYIYHGTWIHLNGGLHKSVPSVSVCLYVYLSYSCYATAR
jgi:hypothetical protein